MKKFTKVVAEEAEGKELYGRVCWTDEETETEIKKVMKDRNQYSRITVTEADLDMIRYLRYPRKTAAGYRIRSNISVIRINTHRDMMTKVAELLRSAKTSFMTLEVKENGKYKTLYTFRVEWEANHADDTKGTKMEIA